MPVRPPPPSDRPLTTLQRVLSKAGIASRSEARAWIARKRLRVNGRVITDPDHWLDPSRDRVTLDGRPVEAAAKAYLLLYKPKGYLTTRKDERGRKTVYDLLPERERYLFPVGRLDLDTSGLLILTNDSTFSERMQNPDFHVPKTYLVKAASRLDDDALDALRHGVTLKDGPTRPAKVVRLREPGGKTVFEITITEGRNRQVRRMVEAVGSKVLKLVRTGIGPLRIGDLPIGKCRPLTPEEVRALQRSGRREAPPGAPSSSASP